MVQDIRIFTLTVDPGGTAAQPTSFDMSMPARTVRAVEIVIPDGVRGLVGIALGLASTAIIPSNAGAYIFGNDEVIHWPLDGFPDSGAWKLFAYNVGTFPHDIQVRFLCDLPGSQLNQPVAYIDSQQLQPVGG